MDTKVVGYSLLIGGILAIILSSISVYEVFTNRVKPIQLFDFPAISINTSNLAPQLDTSSINKTQQTQIISADMVNDTLNVLANLFLMGFIASVGYKIASLGVMLLRPIEVKAK